MLAMLTKSDYTLLDFQEQHRVGSGRADPGSTRPGQVSHHLAPDPDGPGQVVKDLARPPGPLGSGRADPRANRAWPCPRTV